MAHSPTYVNRIIRACQHGMIVEPYVTLAAEDDGIMLIGREGEFAANLYFGWEEIELSNKGDVLTQGVSRVRDALLFAKRTGRLPLAV